MFQNAKNQTIFWYASENPVNESTIKVDFTKKIYVLSVLIICKINCATLKCAHCGKMNDLISSKDISSNRLLSNFFS